MESFISSVNKDESNMGIGKGIKPGKDTVFPDICIHHLLMKRNRILTADLTCRIQFPAMFLKYETSVLIWCSMAVERRCACVYVHVCMYVYMHMSHRHVRVHITMLQACVHVSACICGSISNSSNNFDLLRNQEVDNCGNARWTHTKKFSEENRGVLLWFER